VVAGWHGDPSETGQVAVRDFPKSGIGTMAATGWQGFYLYEIGFYPPCNVREQLRFL